MRDKAIVWERDSKLCCCLCAGVALLPAGLPELLRLGKLWAALSRLSTMTSKRYNNRLRQLTDHSDSQKNNKLQIHHSVGNYSLTCSSSITAKCSKQCACSSLGFIITSKVTTGQVGEWFEQAHSLLSARGQVGYADTHWATLTSWAVVLTCIIIITKC